jgi:hypothetical protein
VKRNGEGSLILASSSLPAIQVDISRPKIFGLQLGSKVGCHSDAGAIAAKDFSFQFRSLGCSVAQFGLKR